ncbi:hypothetical protein N8I71_09110 [Roseibacterium sp. SDUM158016]|uniref:hypothetical protein n=1 Tax=Roseicyclus sediminis TaxID=2980997 RepID=UPI0021D1C3BE|nr:hypothetical protein [Roseibacterium sp. SDUM158016]MCU4652989.1 hypothetical protein [Roseibacterium sp. SDUM158016]
MIPTMKSNAVPNLNSSSRFRCVALSILSVLIMAWPPTVRDRDRIITDLPNANMSHVMDGTFLRL